MVEMNMVQSINSALDNMLEMDQDVLLFGEDIGYFGGVFRTSDGLQKNLANIEFLIRRCPKVELPLLPLEWALMGLGLL